jgi:hypothetical protein
MDMRTIAVVGATGTHMAAALARALGEEIRCQELTPDQYRGLGFPGAEDLGNMFQFKRDFESYFHGGPYPDTWREGGWGLGASPGHPTAQRRQPGTRRWVGGSVWASSPDGKSGKSTPDQ